MAKEILYVMKDWLTEEYLLVGAVGRNGSNCVNCRAPLPNVEWPSSWIKHYRLFHPTVLAFARLLYPKADLIYKVKELENYKWYQKIVIGG